MKSTRSDMLDCHMPVSPAPKGPAGKICYAIGDVHGRSDLLSELVGRILDDAATETGQDIHIVLLGDLVDRGPDSAGVLDWVTAGTGQAASLHVLKGNHEQMVLEAYEGNLEIIPKWLVNGGYEFLSSYHVEIGRLFGRQPAEIHDVLTHHVPARHIDLMDRFADSITFGDYFLVHAGVRPRVPLAEQTPTDLRWIRQPFLACTQQFEKFIVHGHSVCLTLETHPNRLGIDTGAWQTDVLTCVKLKGCEQSFFQTGVLRSHAAV